MKKQLPKRGLGSASKTTINRVTSIGGFARSKSLSARRRKEIARMGAMARNGKSK